MAIKTINWNDGSGDKIYLDPDAGNGNGTIAVSSDRNKSTTPRSQEVNISSGQGSGGVGLIIRLTINQKERPNYFWTEAIAAGTFTLTIPSSVTTAMLESVSYSTDNGVTWVTTNNVNNSVVTITTPTIQAGGKVLWKGIGTTFASGYSSGEYSLFSGSADYNIGGDIGTLFYGDDYTGEFERLSTTNALQHFFSGQSHLINAKDLILSPLRAVGRCYQYCFYNCTNLLTAPTILVESIGTYCCYGMFEGCSSLVVAPNLNITTLNNNCCQRMFMNCTSLTTPPPELKGESLATSCYYSMFNGCAKMSSVPTISATSAKANSTQWMREMFSGCKLITTAPVLPITTLASNCYYRMFRNCSALSYIKMMATDISASNCLYQWVSGVAATGTFVKNSAAQWTATGVSGIPSGWTVQTAAS